MDRLMAIQMKSMSLATDNFHISVSFILFSFFLSLLSFSAGPFAFLGFFLFFENHPT